MRSTVVPAQVTTVEDRIAGSLGMSQLVLLIIPLIVGSLLYVVLPPFFGYHEYKLVLLVVLMVACGLLAIRVKGQIVLLWMTSIIRYNRRPRYFVYSKNSLYAREFPILENDEAESSFKAETTSPLKAPQLSTADLVRVEDILANPQANVRYTTNRKGELRVHITKV